MLKGGRLGILSIPKELWMKWNDPIIISRRNKNSGAATTSLNLPESADAIVIGGGSIGCSTLYHLAKYGIKNAVLLERNQITSGTTWHAAGLYWRLFPSDIQVEMLAYSKRLLTETLPQETGVEAGWTNNGGLFIACNKDRLDEYKRLYSLARIYGIEAHLLDRKETKKLYPFMNVDDVYGSLYSPEDGAIDPTSLCTALAKGARRYGARIFEHCPVDEITTEIDHFGFKKVTGVRTSSCNNVKAPIVINCAGAWAPKLVQPLGVSLPTLTIHHAYVTTEEVPEDCQRLPNIRDHDSAIYVKTQGHALSFGGYEADPTFWDDVRDDFAFGLFDMDWERFERTARKAYNRVPLLERVGIKSTICGPMSFTPDHKPLMGETIQVAGLFVACGIELGIMMAGALGQQAALWAIHGRPDTHLFEYDLRRFNPKVTARNQWVKDKVHEAVGAIYSIHWPRDEPLAGRNQLKSPFHEALLEDGCVFQERHGWERPGWFADDGKQSPVMQYNYHFGAAETINSEENCRYHDEYEERVKYDRTWSWPRHHPVIGNECQAMRTGVGMIDMSSCGKFYLTGPDADAAVAYLFTNDISGASLGTSVHTCALNKHGGVEAILTVSMLESNQLVVPSHHPADNADRAYYIIADCPAQTHVRAHIRSAIRDKRFQVDLIDCTDQFGILSIQGPESGKLLRRASNADPADSAAFLPVFAHKLTAIDGHRCRIFRIPYHRFRDHDESAGYEFHIPLDSCLAVYQAIRRVGREFGLRNVGYRALECILAENGFPVWNGDVRSSDNILEAGLGAGWDHISKNGDCLGKEALRKHQRSRGVRKRLACFVLESDVPMFGLEAIYRNGQPVGVVRRAEYSHDAAKSIVYGLLTKNDGGSDLDDHWVKSGRYEIEARGRRYEAQVRIGPSPLRS